MPIIDSQVHAYEANTPKRPWHSVPNWPDHVTGDEMVAAMDKVGVDGAIFVSPFAMYGYDASYAVEVQRAHPGRFALVKPVDPDDPAFLPRAFSITQINLTHRNWTALGAFLLAALVVTRIIVETTLPGRNAESVAFVISDARNDDEE